MAKRAGRGGGRSSASSSSGPAAAQTIWVRISPEDVPLLSKAREETSMTSPELVSRLLRFFLQHEDFWGLILGMGPAKLRHSSTALLLDEWRKGAVAEMAAVLGESARPGHETEGGVSRRIEADQPATRGTRPHK
jgi:hypothetical protein